MPALGIHEMGNLITKYEKAIRRHRDYRGDSKCWRDDHELYAVLPEGYAPPTEDTALQIQNCLKYIEHRQYPGTVYINPDDEIKRLKQEVMLLQNRLLEAESQAKKASRPTLPFDDLIGAAE